MDKENLERCRRVSVVLTPLKSSEINRWRNQRKSIKKRRPRRKGAFGKPKKPQARKLSVSSSNVDENGARLIDSDVQTPVDGLSDGLPESRADDTRELSLPLENDEPFPLWKYKRKRRSVSSDSGEEKPTSKRLTATSADVAVPSKELTINLPRLRVATPSRGVLLDDESEIDAESLEDVASLIMDSCEDSCDRSQSVEGLPLAQESQESDDEVDDVEETISSSPEPESLNTNGAPSDEENESDNDEELMDLCLMKEPTVLVTKLEDVMEALENNHYFPDRKHLTERHVEIIRGFRGLEDSEDSYCLVMSPDTDKSHSSDSSDDDDLLGTCNFPGRMRNRRRISSDVSSCSEVDPLRSHEDLGAGNEAESPDDASKVEGPPSEAPAVTEEDDSSNSPETLLSNPLSCEECKETFDTVGGVLKHTCEPTSSKKVKSKSKGMKMKKHSRLAPKSTSLECTLCSQTLENHELLQRHLWSHTQREHEEAFKAAKRQSRSKEPRPDVEILSSHESDPEDRSDTETEAAEPNQPGIAIMNEKSSKGKSSQKTSVPVAICPCHVDDLQPTDLTVQIEMVLFCEICKVLFRRSECFETHYRSNALCNKDRRKGRSPRLFCSTCRVVLSNLSDMRKHLEKHVSINRHGTVTFVCNICRVVFFGVGTVFCTHWFNHEKDPMFVASRYSFPKLCVSNRGKNPIGKQPGEQYFFVAEYVCRSCKQQFSSDGDLLNHMRECRGEESKQQPSLPKEAPKSPPAPPPAPEPPKKPVEGIKFNVITKSQMTVAAPPRVPRPRGRPPLLRPPPPRPAPRSAVSAPPPPRPVLSHPPAPRPVLPQSPAPPKVVQLQKLQQVLPKAPEVQDTSSFYVKTWICDICEKVYPTRQSLVQEHAFTHFDATLALEKFNRSVERPYACTICRKAYGSLEGLNKHWLKHELMKYWCSACKDTYYTLSAYIRHVVVLCRKENPSCRVSFGTKEICKLCNLAFKNSEDLSRHNVDYHAAGRIVGTRGGLKPVPQVVVTKAPVTQTPQPSSPAKNLTPITRQFSPIAAKTTLPSSAVILSPSRSAQSSGLVLCVQPQNNNEGGTSQQVNGPVVINIAIPNVVQSSEQTSSPPKVRALEDPTVQVVLTQANPSESTLSASLVTNLSPVKTMETTRGQNSSTFALTVRDTTATGGSVTERDSLVREEGISNEGIASLLQNRSAGENSTGENEEITGDRQVSGPRTGESNLEVEDMPENSTTSNSDDVQILQVMESPQKSSPEKETSVLKAGLTASAADSDIEILSETSAHDEGEKARDGEGDKSKKANRDESSESSGSVTVVKKPLSKPQGFLRVKNLSELQDENKNGQESRGNSKTGNTLTEHLMANLKSARSPSKQQSTSNGVDSGDGEAEGSAPHVPGRRILPNIPQRAQGTEARRATPLSTRQEASSGAKPMNRVTPIPTSNSGMANAHYSRPMNSQLYGALSVDERLQSSVNQGGNTQNTYVCPICPQNYYNTLYDFLTHLAQHQNLPLDVQTVVYSLINEKFPCQMQGQGQLQGQNKYKCLVCSTFETDSPGEFQKHFATHSQQMLSSAIQNYNIAYSQQLGSAVNSMYGYQYQSQVVPSSTAGVTLTPELYRCSLCLNYQFSTYQDLEAHVQAMHGSIINVTDRLVCALCPNLTVFENEQMLKEHQEAQHTFLCTICMQKFGNSYELDAHCNLHKSGQIGGQYGSGSG